MSWNAKKVKKTLFKAVILGVVAYILYIFVDQYIRIRKKNEELESVKQQIAVQKDKNEEMKSELESERGEAGNSLGNKKSGTIVFENVTE